VTAQLVHVADVERFFVIAYCFMPDHLHALVKGTDRASDFRRFVRLFKQRSAFHWKRRYGQILWQRSYFEHVLRDDEAMLGVARYILDNPVRAGLVNRPEQYPYLGSLTMTVPELLYSVHW